MKRKRKIIGRIPIQKKQRNYPFDPWSEEADLPFAEQLLHSPELTDEAKQMIRESLIIDATPVSDYLYSESDQEYWDVSGGDFPNIAPPYENFFLEFKAPLLIHSRERGDTKWTEDLPSAWGLLCYGERLDEVLSEKNKELIMKNGKENAQKIFEELYRQIPPHVMEKINRLSPGMPIQTIMREFSPIEQNLLEQVSIAAHGLSAIEHDDWDKILDMRDSRGKRQWGLTMQLFLRRNTSEGIRCWGPISSTNLLIDTNGSISQSRHGFPEIHHMLFGDLAAQAKKENRDLGKNTLAVEMINGFLNPGFLTLSFLHCKNVEVKKREETIELEYHDLNIRSMKEKIETIKNDERVNSQKALHICRGHFKNYEEGRGLFGKYHGTYWIPQHIRGGKS